ncbi:MAG: MarR family transcriptional regulator [Planctomycetota bacterium]
MSATVLQRRLGKKAPFASPEQEAALGLLYVADRIENRFGRLFREFGLTNSQYNVLRILRGEGGPMPALEVGRRMIQQVPAITGLVDRLDKQGLVTRERSEEDRRVVYVAITAKGLGLLDELDGPLAEVHDELLGGMSRKDLATLTAVLGRAAAAVAAE